MEKMAPKTHSEISGVGLQKITQGLEIQILEEFPCADFFFSSESDVVTIIA